MRLDWEEARLGMRLDWEEARLGMRLDWEEARLDEGRETKLNQRTRIKASIHHATYIIFSLEYAEAWPIFLMHTTVTMTLISPTTNAVPRTGPAIAAGEGPRS